MDKASYFSRAQEIEEYSRIKCCVCGERVAAEEVAEHSRRCVLAPAPKLRLQLDKWGARGVHSLHQKTREERHIKILIYIYIIYVNILSVAS